MTDMTMYTNYTDATSEHLLLSNQSERVDHANYRLYS